MRRPADFPRALWRRAVLKGRRAIAAQQVEAAAGLRVENSYGIRLIWVPCYVGRFCAVGLDPTTGDPVAFELHEGRQEIDLPSGRTAPTRVDGTYPRWLA